MNMQLICRFESVSKYYNKSKVSASNFLKKRKNLSLEGWMSINVIGFLFVGLMANLIINMWFIEALQTKIKSLAAVRNKKWLKELLQLLLYFGRFGRFGFYGWFWSEQALPMVLKNVTIVDDLANILNDVNAKIHMFSFGIFRWLILLLKCKKLDGLYQEPSEIEVLIADEKGKIDNLLKSVNPNYAEIRQIMCGLLKRVNEKLDVNVIVSAEAIKKNGALVVALGQLDLGAENSQKAREALLGSIGGGGAFVDLNLQARLARKGQYEYNYPPVRDWHLKAMFKPGALQHWKNNVLYLLLFLWKILPAVLVGMFWFCVIRSLFIKGAFFKVQYISSGSRAQTASSPNQRVVNAFPSVFSPIGAN